MFHDSAKIHVQGGRGGDGVVSFRREAHVPKGGPDGGDGGHGGDVVLRCEGSRRDLADFRRGGRFRGGRGGHGQGKQRHGARGEATVVPVPPGTEVIGLDGARADLVAPGQQVVVAHGGRGGHGNKRFATSTRRAPRFAEKGTAGESGWIELQLKLLADAGLIGLPNAGKSSLLGRLTRAEPKIAAYPFTTLEPVLGTIGGDERQAVLADIPGLIEGAAGGAGLGHRFLAHVERCAMLVHLVEVAPAEGEPAAGYEAVRAELGSYGAGLEALPELVVDAPARMAQVPADGEPQFSSEHRVYRPEDEGGYWIENEDEGAYRVHGRGVAMLIERHDLGNVEALDYLEQRLTEMGVVAALRGAGFEAGDEIRVGELSFELHPN